MTPKSKEDLAAFLLAAMLAGALLSLVLPWSCWRCGLALFGALMAVRLAKGDLP